MDRHELFDIWAPPTSIWSAWAKPVLFAHLPRPLPVLTAPPPIDLSWLPPSTNRWAVVVDLPGVEAGWLGLALAERGYRPVPVFNACPPPPGHTPPPVRIAAIDVESILAALVAGADRLRSLTIPADAPPAFLVDLLRQRPLLPLAPGVFDNRSVLFTTDFPSALFLTGHGIDRVLLIAGSHGRFDRDLRYVLWTWQRAGISLSVKRGTEPGPIQPLTVGGRWLFFNFWYRLSAFFRLRRNPHGGYGDFIPDGTSG